MSDDKKYNGWTNYETWLVNLWLTNEQAALICWNKLASEWLERAPDNNDHPCLTGREWALMKLAQQMKSEMEDKAADIMEDIEGMWHDLLKAALCEVNWREIATHRIEEALEHAGY